MALEDRIKELRDLTGATERIRELRQQLRSAQVRRDAALDEIDRIQQALGDEAATLRRIMREIQPDLEAMRPVP